MGIDSEKNIRKKGRLIIHRREDCGGSFYCRMKFQDVRGFTRKSLWT